MVTQKEFDAFEECRISGSTNMLDVKTVGILSGLNEDIIKDILTNYNEYSNRGGSSE